MRSGHQTKTGAMIETFCNTFSGFALSWLMWVYVVAPLWKLDVTPADNFWITCIFTVLSLVRSYTWRRLMTRVHDEKANYFWRRRGRDMVRGTEK